MLAAGATILDVGGESTRPGRTEAVPAEEELRRVVPVVEALARRHPDLVISIDTVKASVARAALDAGAAVVNDVSAFRLDPEMAATVAAAKAGVILMHSRGPILEVSSYPPRRLRWRRGWRGAGGAANGARAGGRSRELAPTPP